MSNPRAPRPLVPEPLRPAYEALLARLDDVADRLPEELVPLLGEAAAVLAKKRPSPLLRGDSASWACGITLALGAENGLFAPRRRAPAPTPAEVARAFGVAPSTGAAKAAAARRHLGIRPLEIPEPDVWCRWCVPAVRAERRRVLGAAARRAVSNPPAPR